MSTLRSRPARFVGIALAIWDRNEPMPCDIRGVCAADKRKV
jgi:hypothetical protein